MFSTTRESDIPQNPAWVCLTGANGRTGQRLSRHLLEEGYGLFLTARTMCDAQRSRTELEREFPQASVIAAVLELADPDSIRKALETGPAVCHGLILCGFGDDQTPIEELTEGRMTEYLKTQIVGNLLIVTEYVRRCHEAQREGKIIFLSSLMAGFGAERSLLYGCAKAALESALRHLATETGRSGIRANTIRLPQLRWRMGGKEREAAPLADKESDPLITVCAQITLLLSDCGSAFQGAVLSPDNGASNVLQGYEP